MPGGILVETPCGIGSLGGARVAERVRVRTLGSQEGNRLLCIVRRSTRPAVTWRRAQMVLRSAPGMDLAQIRRSIAWRNRHAHDRRIGEIVTRANVA
jgi:hypothetical protein